MKTYKAPDNSLHAIEPEFAHMLPAGCVEITEAEADEIRALNQPQLPQKTKEQRIHEILDSVGCFNENHLQKDIFVSEAFGALQGVTPQQLYQANPGYTSLIDARNAIEAIKAE